MGVDRSSRFQEQGSSDMFTLGTEWWEIVLRATVVYIAVWMGMRVFGRHSLGQRNALDLVLILIVANAVQNAMIGPDTSLIGGLIAAGTLFLIDWGLTKVIGKNERTRRFFEGSPVVLINHGHLIESNMRKEGIDQDELAEVLHEHGLETASQVKTAILEIDGSLSIIPAAAPSIQARKRLTRSPKTRQ